MQISINKIDIDVPEQASLQQAVACFESAHGVFTRPYAAAVNLQFVPSSQYASTPLQAGDQVEVIRPVTGG
jgi:sulfur carrier protein